MKKAGLVLTFSLLATIIVFTSFPLGQVLTNDVMLPGLAHSTSLNWAGYAVGTASGAVSNVVGAWTVPAVTKTRMLAYSAFWVGIDGYNSATVEQIGTESDFVRGHASYYAWYEMYPKVSVKIPMTISPGDNMWAEVNYTGSNTFVLTLYDNSREESFTTTQTSTTAVRSSAEWIAEAPSTILGVMPLAKFGTVSFSSCAATINGGSFPISGFSYDAITMTTRSGVVKAWPSGLYNSGYNFDVTWGKMPT